MFVTYEQLTWTWSWQSHPLNARLDWSLAKRNIFLSNHFCHEEKDALFLHALYKLCSCCVPHPSSLVSIWEWQSLNAFLHHTKWLLTKLELKWGVHCTSLMQGCLTYSAIQAGPQRQNVLDEIKARGLASLQWKWRLPVCVALHHQGTWKWSKDFLPICVCT